MTRKRNICGQSILEELRRQSEDINLNSEDGLEQISLNDDGDEISETAMLNQNGGDLAEPAAPKNKRDENEPLLVKVKDGQGRDNGSNLFVRFLGQENFEFDYAASVKWALRTLGDRWKAHKYNLRGEYFFPNKRKAEILAANPSDIPPVEWTDFVDHYMDPKTKEKIAEHLSEDQERAAAEGIHSKVLAHPDDAIGKVCSPENGKQVRGFSNAAYPSGFGKSKRIFGGAICGGSSSASQQHVAELEKQLQKAKGQVATLYRFLQQKYGEEVPIFSDSVPHIESE
ncbi:hypothetical protein Ahy_A01g003063 [Arachis hypogaea]|uniref:Uncharacterized protein n=1 Tax=Arachis hypogaea TaxID=3818 RepID=A0A445ES48_ARAHY|nr:hypothetical protein Ahy_A01g003063 [Arachis hypogaea]